LRTTLFKRSELAFNLLIPKNWRDTPLKVKSELLEHDTENMVPVTLQLAPENEKGDARIEVAYILLDAEINLSDMVDLYLKNTNLKVLMRREGTYNQRKVDEVLVHSKVNSKSYLVRMTFSRHGDRVFVVSGSAVKTEFLRYSKIFAAAAVSFTVQQKEASQYAEPMDTCVITGPPRLEFQYPKDWQLKEAQGLPSGKCGVDISLVGQDERGEAGVLFALIHIKGIAQGTGEKPERVFDNLKSDFEGIAVTFGPLTLEVDLGPKWDAPLAKLKKWKATLSGTPAEVSLLVWPQSTGYLALGLLTTSSQVSRFLWMHAWRVFEVVISDLTGRQMPLAKLKNLALPPKARLENMAARTMSDFAQAVMKEDFSHFYAGLAPIFQAQTTHHKLQQAFGRFKARKELDELTQHPLILDHPVWIDEEGSLDLSGYFLTRPELTCFKLTYKYAQDEWKLISIRVFMEKPKEPYEIYGMPGEAKDHFEHPTTWVNRLWRTDFTY